MDLKCNRCLLWPLAFDALTKPYESVFLWVLAAVGILIIIILVSRVADKHGAYPELISGEILTPVECPLYEEANNYISPELFKEHTLAAVEQRTTGGYPYEITAEEFDRLLSIIQPNIRAISGFEYTYAEVTLHSTYEGWITISVKTGTGEKTGNYGGSNPSSYVRSANNFPWDIYSFNFEYLPASKSYELRNTTFSGPGVPDDIQRCALHVAKESKELKDFKQTDEVTSLNVTQWIPHEYISAEWGQLSQVDIDTAVVGASLKPDERGCEFSPFYLLVDPWNQRVLDTKINREFAACPDFYQD